MAGIHAQDVAMCVAHREGHLRIEERHSSRVVGGVDLGPYWAIVDRHGTLEICLSREEADLRVANATAEMG